MTDTFLTESTKFQVSPAPTQAPGTCASCGSSDQETRDFIDFGLTLDFYGVFYLCTFCLNECANALGYASPEQARSLEKALEQASLEITNFYTKNRALNDAITLLRDSGLFDLVDGPASSSDEVAINEINGSLIQDDSTINGSESNANKQDSKQGRNNLSADGDDVDIAGLLSL